MGFWSLPVCRQQRWDRFCFFDGAAADGTRGTAIVISMGYGLGAACVATFASVRAMASTIVISYFAAWIAALISLQRWDEITGPITYLVFVAGISLRVFRSRHVEMLTLKTQVEHEARSSRKEASHDSLTGLLNRKELSKSSKKEVANRFYLLC